MQHSALAEELGFGPGNCNSQVERTLRQNNATQGEYRVVSMI